MKAPAHNPAAAPHAVVIERDGHLLRLPNGTWIAAPSINVVVALRNRGTDDERPNVLVETPRGQWKCPALSWDAACALRDAIAGIVAEYGPPPDTAHDIPYPEEATCPGGAA